jgi:hypothetical protein
MLTIKKSSTGSVLMIIGMSGEILFIIFHNFLVPVLMKAEVLSYTYYDGFGFIAIQLLQILFSLMFAIGLLILVSGIIKRQNPFD